MMKVRVISCKRAWMANINPRIAIEAFEHCVAGYVRIRVTELLKAGSTHPKWAHDTVLAFKIGEEVELIKE